jgi:3-hydroxyacyl-CoA dehydrogenase
MGVSIEKVGTVAYVTIDNPPVNAIGAGERQDLLDVATTLSGDPDIDRVVITGQGKTFAAGADAREFDSDPIPPHLPDVIAAIEASPVPWIAAINGPALGGGAEIALGCRYRIAQPSATIGLPEVNLGVVPGAGGTQRLPRLLGLQKALELIPEGKIIKAGDARAIGLVDIVADDAANHAGNLDLSELAGRVPLSEAPAPRADAAAMEATRERAAKRMRRQDAPLEAVRLVGLAATEPFADAMIEERATFVRLRKSDQAKALRHIFFAERGAKTPPWLADTAPLEVTKAVVVGGGNMGAAIGYALDMAGIAATIIETDEEAATRARDNVARLVDGAVKRGRMSETEAEAARSRMPVVVGYADLPEADLAIEAVFEDMAVKKQVFTHLQDALPPQAILATNTSYLDIDAIAGVLDVPERLVGLHFFSPAHIMRLLEIVRGDRTSDRVLATAFALARRLRKIPVLAGVCDGFIGNRILARYREAADTLLMDGATPWQIDGVMVEFGYPMGPYEAQDMSGLDIAYANRQRQAATRDPDRRYIPISDRMVEEGRLGRKTGVGWYRYPGEGGPVMDPLVEDLIREESHFAKVERRDYADQEVRDRLLTAMINEATAILEEGIAGSAADIDLVTVHGYGFPRWRGGLMFHADRIGAAKLLERLKSYAGEDALVWTPSPLLQRLAAEGGRFADV